MLNDPFDARLHGGFALAAAAAGLDELLPHLRVGTATEPACCLAAHGADAREQIACGDRFGTEVGQFDGNRRGVEIIGRRDDLHGLDVGRFRQRDHVGDILLRPRVLLRHLLLELLEVFLDLRRAGRDHPRGFRLGHLVDDQRHREQHDHVHEHADRPGGRLLEESASERTPWGSGLGHRSWLCRGWC